MDNKFLMQEEIDALLNGDDSLLDFVDAETAKAESFNSETIALTPAEADVLGEVGNISMGSAATTLSQLINQTVLITSPKVRASTQVELFETFTTPYMAIEVDYTQGLQGRNLLVMKVKDASVIANMMMGGDGTDIKEVLTEIELSAASEAMNQMIGSSATSMSQIFDMPINISPPNSRVIETEKKDYEPFLHGKITIVSFRMTIGDLVDTEIMQIMSTEVAKEQVAKLSNQGEGEQPNSTPAPLEEEPVHQLEPSAAKQLAINNTPNNTELNPRGLLPIDKKYDLILDIPLKVSVILGKSRKSIGEVLRIIPGSIIELDKILGEDVEILVNGTIVATGEVVVVDENFGVRIKNIISPAERINYIK